MKLVIFDCDGTLVDSQRTIVEAMNGAFAQVGLAAPQRPAVLGVVGLSLPEAMMKLAPEATALTRHRLVDAYRSAAQSLRLSRAEDDLFAGADACVRALAARDDLLLGIATGKSRRGVARLVDHYGWQGFFATVQTADDAPSKPDPAMIAQALAETGVDAASAVMIGDTTYDVSMAKAAAVVAIGVTWGYHAAGDLQAAGADRMVESFGALSSAIDDVFASRGGLS